MRRLPGSGRRNARRCARHVGPRLRSVRHGPRRSPGRWRGRGPEWRPKSSLGPDAGEAVKDRFTRFRWNPGPSSSTLISTSPPTAVARISTSPPGGEKDMALSTRLSKTRASRNSSPSTTAVPTRGRAKAICTPLRSAASQAEQRLDQSAEIDRLEPGPRQLGVEPRDLGDVDDQPVEPGDVVAHDVEHLVAQRRSSTRSRLSTADRSEARGFLSSWVTSAAKASVESIRWRALGHVVQRPGEQADLVPPRRQYRHVDLARPAEPDPVGGERQLAKRQAMVRARNRDSRTETIRVTKMTISRVPRSSRTMRLMSRALRVRSSTSPEAGILEAAEMNKVPSGARRSMVVARGAPRAATASLHPSIRLGSGRRKARRTAFRRPHRTDSRAVGRRSCATAPSPDREAHRWAERHSNCPSEGRRRGRKLEAACLSGHRAGAGAPSSRRVRRARANPP